MRDARPEPDRTDASRLRALAAGFAGLAAATFALVVLGALVRAHGAGLACPDWPLCFGEVMPRLDFRVAFEFAHRVLAGSIALAFAALGVATLRVRTARAAVGGWLATGAALLGVQVLLGALTVWLGLAPWTVIAHLVTGNAFAVTLVLVVLRLRRAAAPVRPSPCLAPGVRPLVTLAAGALVAQVVLGGLVSSTYAGLACASFPTCDGAAWFPSLEGPVGVHLAHRTGAYLVLAILAVATLAVRRPPALVRALGVAFGLACVQAGVGITGVLLRLPVELTGLHTALAAALVATLGVAVHEAWTAPVQPAGFERGVPAANARSAAAPRA
ncbi:MAG TPA: COX15/CtaA family protein [Myxococcota bacterium]|nr:COX15/CtaA family protein [Myxococcota bacterium]